MTDVVLDASATVTVLVERTNEAHELRECLGRLGRHAPHLVDAEVGSVLRRRVGAGMLPAELAEGALRALDTLVVQRYPHGPLAPTVWGLRHNFSYYDALYVALAARLRAPLLTADKRLANAPGLPCEVELIN
ncbi:type II toxin-antitoxin system VapC family toxin [Pseudonocardia cypriaca]|uniref:type II toxin-antitoxin system VapC family toxin n=1 Tax=Pseudonocardia cypriaca TaxID=882449 RepID=UPI0011542E58|nr:type II toxin-antitoxin system VapC family toxin [Pseudonocardia cypriaca]